MINRPFLRLYSSQILTLGKLAQNFFLSGPNLPKAIADHSMVEYGDSLLLIGGYSYNFLNSIFSLTCEARICVWTELSQQLYVGRVNMVTAIIPDSMTGC